MIARPKYCGRCAIRATRIPARSPDRTRVPGSPGDLELDRQRTNPLEPARDHLQRVLLPQPAVEELERQRAAVADRAQVGDHARQVGDALADHHAVLVLLGERVGLGRHVVDVEAGEAIAREREQVVDRPAAADHVEDVGHDRGPRIAGSRGDRPGARDVLDAVDEARGTPSRGCTPILLADLEQLGEPIGGAVQVDDLPGRAGDDVGAAQLDGLGHPPPAVVEDARVLGPLRRDPAMQRDHADDLEARRRRGPASSSAKLPPCSR